MFVKTGAHRCIVVFGPFWCWQGRLDCPVHLNPHISKVIRLVLQSPKEVASRLPLSPPASVRWILPVGVWLPWWRLSSIVLLYPDSLRLRRPQSFPLLGQIEILVPSLARCRKLPRTVPCKQHFYQTTIATIILDFRTVSVATARTDTVAIFAYSFAIATGVP